MFSYAPEARCATFLCFGKSMRNRRVVILVSPPRTTASRSVLGSGLASHAFGFSLKSELLVQQKLRGSPLLYCATIAVLRCVEKLAKIFLSLCRIMDPTFDAQQCRESSRKCWRHFLSQQCNCELFHEIQNYVQGNVFVCTMQWLAVRPQGMRRQSDAKSPCDYSFAAKHHGFTQCTRLRTSKSCIRF